MWMGKYSEKGWQALAELHQEVDLGGGACAVRLSMPFAFLFWFDFVMDSLLSGWEWLGG